jgi:YD repeat-containing protein
MRMALLNRIFQMKSAGKAANRSRLTLLVFLMAPITLMAGSYATVSYCTHTTILGFSTYEEAGLAGWDNGKCEPDPNITYGGIIYYDWNGNDTYWWGIQSVGFDPNRVYMISYNQNVPVTSSILKQSHEVCAGDPIIVATGNSFQTEVDYQSQKSSGLSFTRYYNSSAYIDAAHSDIGKKWQHNFNRRISVTDTNILAYRSNGQAFTFNYDGSNWVGDVDIPDTLVELVDEASVRTGWAYTDRNDNIELFNANGQLTSITNRAGQIQTFEYHLATVDGGDDNSNTLDKVVGFGGEEMLFAYDREQRISTMTDPEGNQYSYNYDAAGNLESVIYPDDTPLDDTDNPSRIYHYENASFPSHLTGLTDETGSRVTWDFDSEGRAISSELDGGVDKSSLDFSVADQVTVTNPLGKDTTYHFETMHGVKKVTQVEGHATQSCTGANQNYTYDANGYLASKTDWQGNVTTYVHDARGLETSRTEASGTPQARTITTEWHSDFRLPIKVTAPGQITDFVYDTQGLLTSQTTHDVQ